MPKKSECWGIVCAAALAAPLPNAAYAADALIDAIAGGKVSGNFRLRYEDVNTHAQDVAPASRLEDATAFTLRSRLGYETAPFNGFTAMLEFEDIHTVNGKDEYSPEYKNSAKAANNPYDYAPIVDPSHTEINRAYLRYRGVPKLDMSLGRQRIILDNQRFVGAVAWRQDEQTFDAFSAKYDGIADWSFYYAYIDKVNGIASEKPIYNFDFDSSDNLFNISYSGFTFGKITAYGYFLDNQSKLTDLLNTGVNNNLNPALRYQKNDTIGARFDGVYILPITAPLRLFYTAEYAKQELTTPADVEFDTKYSLLEAGVGYASKYGMLSAKVAEEVLGSDTVGTAMRGFQTPYATKHAFNGWVDMFLNTPDGGLKDRYATLAADLQPYGVKLMAMYHKYSEDEGPLSGGGARDFGTEWNLQALKQFGANYTLGVKYGKYNADREIATATNIDTRKLWLWGELNF